MSEQQLSSRRRSPSTLAGRSGSGAPVCEPLEGRRLMSVTNVQEFPVLSSNAGLQGITTGKDGNYYAAEQDTKLLARLTPAGVVTEYPLLGSGGPALPATGPDGNIYVPQTDGISVFSPRRQRTTSFINTGTAVIHITTAKDGNMYFTEPGTNKIGRLVVSSQTVTTLDIPTASSQPYVIAPDAAGALWFTELNTNKIGHVIFKHGVFRKIVDFDVPTAGSGPAGIVQGPDGNIWFAENAVDQIGRINPTTGVITEFALPTVGAAPLDVTPGQDGNVYFSENLSGKIGSITPAGVIEETDLVSSFSGPVFFAPGAGNTLFLTEHATDKIAEITYG